MLATELLCRSKARLPHRHCERSEAIHIAASQGMYCFVASPPLRKRFAFVAGNDEIECYRRLSYVLPNAIIQSRCSSVSGTVRPRAVLIRASASLASIPEQISAHAAIMDDLPIPARQWIATERPPAMPLAIELAICNTSTPFSGTPRSGIGKDRNSIPLDRQSSASRCNPSSETSSRSSRLTTISRPEAFHSPTSVSSQSSARGRAEIAIRPVADNSIQCNRDILKASNSVADFASS